MKVSDVRRSRAREVLGEISRSTCRASSIENKGPVIAFHYRRRRPRQGALAAIRTAIAMSAAARRFRVHEGRKVIELRPPLAIDKGTASRELTRRMGASVSNRDGRRRDGRRYVPRRALRGRDTERG